ncbi:MAG: 1-acyl-sn-glycerol-3-phosphate acyltransferase [Spirochaetota bacterium]
MQEKKPNFLYKLFVRLVHRLSSFLFAGIEVYTPNKRQEIPSAFPNIFLGNHVAELDVAVLCSLYNYMQPACTFVFPVREDIVQKRFLSNAFPAKGIKKMVFSLVDFSNIIPFLINYTGGIPVKRPFRANSRELLKEGKLREMVTEQWVVLAERAALGSNVFLFPEGKLSYDGWINPILRGMYSLRDKILGVKYTPFTMSYDFLTYAKPKVHLGFGDTVPFSADLTEKEFSLFFRNMLGDLFVVTPGNLFSFVLFTSEVKKGVSITRFCQLAQEILTELELKGNIYIAGEFANASLSELFAHPIELAQQKGFLNNSNQELRGTERLYDNEKFKYSYLRKKNPYLFHRNQLRSFQHLLKNWE